MEISLTRLLFSFFKAVEIVGKDFSNSYDSVTHSQISYYISYFQPELCFYLLFSYSYRLVIFLFVPSLETVLVEINISYIRRAISFSDKPTQTLCSATLQIQGCLTIADENWQQ